MLPAGGQPDHMHESRPLHHAFLQPFSVGCRALLCTMTGVACPIAACVCGRSTIAWTGTWQIRSHATTIPWVVVQMAWNDIDPVANPARFADGSASLDRTGAMFFPALRWGLNIPPSHHYVPSPTSTTTIFVFLFSFPARGESALIFLPRPLRNSSPSSSPSFSSSVH